MATWTSKVDYTDKVLAADFNALQTLKADMRALTNAQRIALGGMTVGEFGFETDIKDLYIGAAGGDQLIACASAGVWNRQGVVIYPDSYTSQTLEPTLIAPEANPVVLTADIVWKMWFAGSGGVYYAESLDGIHWTRYWPGGNPSTPVVLNRWRPFVIKDGGTYHLYCSPAGDTQIDHYTSADGVTFTLAHAAVISGNDSGWNPTGLNNNSGGIVVGGTFYLFVEQYPTGIGLYTSVNFYTFTPVSLVIPGSYQGPTGPFLKNGIWYLWIGSNVGMAYSNQWGVQRWSAPALTGPWTNSEPGYDFLPETADEGANTPYSEVIDPAVIEVGGKTYLYYVGNQGTVGSPQLYQAIKVAVANVPLNRLVKTAGGSTSVGLDSPGQLTGLDWDYAAHALKDISAKSVKTSGNIETAAELKGINVGLASTGLVFFLGRSRISSSANGKVTFTNEGSTRGNQFDMTADNLLQILTLGGNDTVKVHANKFKATGLPSYANNAAALVGGLTAGDFYCETGTNPLRIAVVY